MFCEQFFFFGLRAATFVNTGWHVVKFANLKMEVKSLTLCSKNY